MWNKIAAFWNRLSPFKNRILIGTTKVLDMKKNKIAFESIFWAAYDIECPFEVGVAFFDYATLESYKQMLNETIVYAHKNKVYKKDHPAPVFVYYTAFRSFLKACFCLQFKSKK